MARSQKRPLLIQSTTSALKFRPLPAVKSASPPISPDKQAAFTRAESRNIHFGNAAEPRLSFLEALKMIGSHFKNSQNPAVAKAFATKYGADILFPALFAVPVVGWALGILTMPLAGRFSKKGDQQLQDYAKDPQYKNHPAIRAEKIANYWNKEKVLFDKLVKRYNKFINALFPTQVDGVDNLHNIKWQNKLKLSDQAKQGWPYKRLKQLVDAKNALEGSVFRHVVFPFTALHKGLEKINCPRPIRRIFLLPKYALLALFFLLKKAPK